MTSKSLRLAILAAFALAVLSGPALALCSGDLQSGCCCTKDRTCPRPLTPDARSMACCKSAPPAPPPLSGNNDRVATSALDLASVDTAQATVEPQRPPVAGIANAAAGKKTVSGIGLYTLHAAFLI